MKMRNKMDFPSDDACMATSLVGNARKDLLMANFKSEDAGLDLTNSTRLDSQLLSPKHLRAKAKSLSEAAAKKRSLADAEHSLMNSKLQIKRGQEIGKKLVHNKSHNQHIQQNPHLKSTATALKRCSKSEIHNEVSSFSELKPGRLRNKSGNVIIEKEAHGARQLTASNILPSDPKKSISRLSDSHSSEGNLSRMQRRREARFSKTYHKDPSRPRSRSDSTINSSKTVTKNFRRLSLGDGRIIVNRSHNSDEDGSNKTSTKYESVDLSLGRKFQTGIPILCEKQKTVDIHIKPSNKVLGKTEYFRRAQENSAINCGTDTKVEQIDVKTNPKKNTVSVEEIVLVRSGDLSHVQETKLMRDLTLGEEAVIRLSEISEKNTSNVEMANDNDHSDSQDKGKRHCLSVTPTKMGSSDSPCSSKDGYLTSGLERKAQDILLELTPGKEYLGHETLKQSASDEFNDLSALSKLNGVKIDLSAPVLPNIVGLYPPNELAKSQLDKKDKRSPIRFTVQEDWQREKMLVFAAKDMFMNQKAFERFGDAKGSVRTSSNSDMKVKNNHESGNFSASKGSKMAPKAHMTPSGSNSEFNDRPNTRISEDSSSVSSDIGRPKRMSTPIDTFEKEDPAAARYSEAVRQARLPKKRNESEDFDDVVIGTRVSEGHQNWVMAYNMLTGIRIAVSRTVAKNDRELKDSDFTAKHKYSFDVTGNELTPSAKYDFKFKDYAPWVFRKIREEFGVDPADYLVSLTGKYVLSEMGTPGKSGSFFYFSRDYRFIIKTIHHSEHKFLRKILREYFEHAKDNENTLISQFYGLHRVKQPFGRKVHFVVMNNLFPAHHDIHQTFDLKGSLVGRYYDERLAARNHRATLKDLNWIQRKMCLLMGPIKREQFLNTLEKDVAFLSRIGIMDYSLLVGIHDIKRGNQDRVLDATLSVFNPATTQNNNYNDEDLAIMSPHNLKRVISRTAPVSLGRGSPHFHEHYSTPCKRQLFNLDHGGFRASYADNTPANFIYYLGIIDLLTKYTTYKKLERFFKGMTHPKTQISAIPPKHYADRLLNFLKMSIRAIKSPKSKLKAITDHSGQASREDTRSSTVSSSQIHENLMIPTAFPERPE